MVRQKGLEPPTYCLEGSCSIQLSYWRIKCGAGDGNRTRVSSLEGWCSTIELHPHSSASRIQLVNFSIVFPPCQGKFPDFLGKYSARKRIRHRAARPEGPHWLADPSGPAKKKRGSGRLYHQLRCVHGQPGDESRVDGGYDINITALLIEAGNHLGNHKVQQQHAHHCTLGT